MRGVISIRRAALGFALASLLGQASHAYSSSGSSFQFLPSAPESEFLQVADSGLDHGFCSKWDPEYGHLGKACCGRMARVSVRRLPRCAPQRTKWTFCDEMTADQREFLELVKSGQARNWWENRGAVSSQAFCSVNSGFLVNGRPLVSTPENRILIRNPNRCTNFGTDGLVAAMEWLGREVAREYSSPSQAGVHINVGDLSAPRGGCIFGRRGGRGHASHTTGQDADIGFLNPRVGPAALNAFTHAFDAESNWWLIKKLFQNPHACVKSVFLDRRLIRKLARAALGDPYWSKVASRIQHVRGHRSHIHFRVGAMPGEPGCPREQGLDAGDEEELNHEDSPGESAPGEMAEEGTPFWKVSDASPGDSLSTSSSAPLKRAP